MLQIDHIGYAVRKMNEAIHEMEPLGYVFEKTIKDEARNIMITFGNLKESRIELVAPLTDGSPVERILKNLGPMPYHICYCSDDFKKDTEKLCGGGYKMILLPAPAVAFNGRRVVFLYSLAVGLVEIVEK